MTCTDRKQDLLLLTHGELGTLRRVVTQAHLWRCPRCQEQSARLGTASILLAQSLREHFQAPRRIGKAVQSASPFGITFAAQWVWAVLVLILFVGLFLGTRLVAGHHPFRGVTMNRPHLAVQHPPGGCRPDLPNAQCR